MNKTGRTLGIAAACLLAATQASAQLSLSPRMVGTGGAYVGIARGQDALFLNPANLALPGNPRWSLGLAHLGVSGTTAGPSFDDFARLLLLGESDGESRTAEFLNLIPASGLEMNVEARLPLLALQAGSFAFGVSSTGVVQQTFDRDVVDLLLNSYTSGRTDYRVGNTAGSYAAYLDFAAAYGRRVGPVTLGVAGHYLHGGTVSRSRMLEPRYDQPNSPIEIDYLEVYSEGGRGFSLDVGAAYQPLKRLTLSGSVSNLIGSAGWSDELWIRQVTLGEQDLDSDLPALAERFRGSQRRMGTGTHPPAAPTMAAELKDGADLPATLRLGAAYAPANGTRLGVSYQKVAESRLAGGWNQSVGLGIQQRLALIGLRAGVASNLDGANMLSGGVSLGPIDLSVARTEGETAGVSRSGWIGSFGISMRGGFADR
jgi:long-subunit fatty acid transport protein